MVFIDGLGYLSLEEELIGIKEMLVAGQHGIAHLNLNTINDLIKSFHLFYD